jgi:acetoin utilization deacetylase AcuC-like enzyme
MATGFAWHERYAWHDTGRWAGLVPSGGLVQPYIHVENSETKSRLAGLLEVSGLLDQLTRLKIVPATREDVLRVHTVRHLDRIEEQSATLHGGDAGDGWSPFGTGSYEIALLAAGGTIAATSAVLTGAVDNAYALVRPPGHHAERDRGIGFCIFNNVAVAIEWARANHGVERIAVVDYDVHHGNGTQEIFYSDPNTLTISVHQNRLFPSDSGMRSERGAGAGEGFALNVPLPAGSGNGAYVTVFERIVLPALQAFRPELIMVASGFDASINDPLGRMLVTASGYRQLTKLLMVAAAELCSGRLVMSHEGGYSAEYVPFCGMAVLEEMSGRTTEVEHPFAGSWDDLPGQELEPWQSHEIEGALALLPLLESKSSTTPTKAG